MARLVITPSCAVMKAWTKLKLESRVASYHLPLLLMPPGDGGKISRQSAEVCEYAVPPKRGKFGGAVSAAADGPNNLALVVDAEGETAISEVGKC